MKRAIVAMGGGPTRVINRSLFGIVDEAAKHGIDVLGALHGIQGVLKEDFRPLSTWRPPLSTARSLPGAAIFSTRYKPTAEDCAKAFEIFKKRQASYFFYIGGNDTAEATAIVSRAAQSADHELRCFHVPKTIDNDLVENDHSPGYGSAARFVAHALLGDDLDVLSLPGIKIDIIMGRKAGWLAAAAALCKRSEEDGPHLIYFPERPRSLAQIVGEVLEVYRKHGRAVAPSRKGCAGRTGRNSFPRNPSAPSFPRRLTRRSWRCSAPLARSRKPPAARRRTRSATSSSPARGRWRTSSPRRSRSPRSRRSARRPAAARTRSATSSAATRASPRRWTRKRRRWSGARPSSTPSRRARAAPWRFAPSGPAANYRARTELIPLEAVAGKERLLPDEFINAEGNGVTPAFVHYAMPLVGKLLR